MEHPPPILKKFLHLFKKSRDHHPIDKTSSQESEYPPELERQYKVTKKVLGVGSFATVKECIHRSSGQSFALKIILKKAIEGKENMLHSELDILKQVRHQHIVSMHALYDSKTTVYIITDLAAGGELFQQLLSKGHYTEKDASHLVSQVLEGLSYLHDHDIIHRDLKPENLLFQTTAEDANLMITDFGLSKILRSQDDILMTSCGTPGYVAPEVLKQHGYGKPVDLWSLGVITYILLVGYTPFYGADQSELFSSIMKGEYSYEEEYWSHISDSAKDFIDGLLAYKPEQRLTAEQALQHPWIVNSLNNDTRHTTNLITNVRRGFSSHPSFRSAMDTLAWNDIDGDDDGDHTDCSNHHSKKKEKTVSSKTTADLDIGKRPKRKSLLGKHLKLVVGNNVG
ncbi:kinase-like domain-containing protein [Halteromyces radiatus]|uniref:kinase-like domain-containing protein n=1 Tax=Halteromyces radiatus TaxID=101107 RepID=UPI00221FB229|nr:kinase-like domain-containing protein [Halteromyces radiatus]KAI8089488.1 kinase-like domain-containing protein [Halteromyces radiatus]